MSMQTGETPLISKSNYPALITAAAVCSLIVLDTNVVAVSLPSIARTFHATFAEIEWVVSAYMVALAIRMLTAEDAEERPRRVSEPVAP